METATSQSPATVSSLPQPTSPPAAPAPEAKRSPKRAFMILGVVLAVALVGVGIYLFATRNDESTDDAQVEADVIPIAPRVGGPVVKVDVTDNQPVKVGEVLFELDPADYDAKAAQAQADLALAQAQALAAHAQETIVEAQASGGLVSAKAALSGSSIGVSAADQQILSAEAAIARAQADQRKAELDYKRTQALFADKAVAQDRMDAAQATYDGANAALKSAQAQLAASRDSKTQAVTRVTEAEGRFSVAKPIEAQIAAAQAQALAADAKAQSAQASLDLAKLQRAYTKVTASVDGIISRTKLEPGDLIAAGQTVMELVPNKVYIEANFKETQIGKMKPGQPVGITVDALGRRKFKGKVESLSGGTGARFSLLPPDNASGNFVKVVQRLPVRIGFVDLPGDVRLPAGLSVDVTVHED
jgi:membrane fusion protein (multidrug efflux system)